MPKGFHLDQPVGEHLEGADFISRPKAILYRPEYPKRLSPLSLNIEHCVDHVFQHPRARNCPFFGYMTNDKNTDVMVLRQSH